MRVIHRAMEEVVFDANNRKDGLTISVTTDSLYTLIYE